MPHPNLCAARSAESMCNHVPGRTIILKKTLKTSRERRLNSWVSMVEELMAFGVSLEILSFYSTVRIVA